MSCGVSLRDLQQAFPFDESLALPSFLAITLACSPALSGSLWLSLTLTGSLWSSLALTLSLSVSLWLSLPHKALARLATVLYPALVTIMKC